MSDTEEYEEYTLLDYARDGDKEPFEELFAQPDGLKTFLDTKDEFNQANLLHMAAANGHSDLLEYFISKLEDPKVRKDAVNAVNDSGNTPMHWAALTGSLDSVKLSYKAGADPLKKNKSGFDSCYQADSAGQDEVANFLYSVADIDREDAEDESEGANEQGADKSSSTQ